MTRLDNPVSASSSLAENRHGFAADELEDTNVARLEVIAFGRTKHRDQTEHAAARIAERTREDLVGRRAAGAIDHHGAVVEPHPGEQVFLRPIEQLRHLLRGVVAARELDVLVRHDQGTRDAIELARAMANELLQRARILTVVFVDTQ